MGISRGQYDLPKKVSSFTGTKSENIKSFPQEDDAAKKKRRRDKMTGESLSSDGGSDVDDTVGHLEVSPGEIIDGKYKFLSVGGIGTFGKVLMATDLSTNRTVAIKVVRRIARYTDSARIEAGLLKDVARADPGRKSLVVHMSRTFDFKGHCCMIFEPLGPSLYDLIKLIHTDLKLENILLCSRSPFIECDKMAADRIPSRKLVPRRTDIRLIDLGGATYETDPHKSSLIATRQYRAPEVILGMEWSMPSDIWSVGCILMELYAGELLFQTNSSLEHLALIEAILGKESMSSYVKELYSKGVRKIERYYHRNGECRYWRTASKESRMHVRSAKNIESIIHPADTVFLDLIRQLLEPNPNKRITAKEALKHRFFTSVRGPPTYEKPAVMPLAITDPAKVFRNYNRDKDSSSMSKDPSNAHRSSGPKHSHHAHHPPSDSSSPLYTRETYSSPTSDPAHDGGNGYTPSPRSHPHYHHSSHHASSGKGASLTHYTPIARTRNHGASDPRDPKAGSSHGSPRHPVLEQFQRRDAGLPPSPRSAGSSGGGAAYDRHNASGVQVRHPLSSNSSSQTARDRHDAHDSEKKHYRDSDRERARHSEREREEEMQEEKLRERRRHAWTQVGIHLDKTTASAQPSPAVSQHHRPPASSANAVEHQSPLRYVLQQHSHASPRPGAVAAPSPTGFSASGFPSSMPPPQPPQPPQPPSSSSGSNSTAMSSSSASAPAPASSVFGETLGKISRFLTTRTSQHTAAQDNPLAGNQYATPSSPIPLSSPSYTHASASPSSSTSASLAYASRTGGSHSGVGHTSLHGSPVPPSPRVPLPTNSPSLTALPSGSPASPHAFRSDYASPSNKGDDPIAMHLVPPPSRQPPPIPLSPMGSLASLSPPP